MTKRSKHKVSCKPTTRTAEQKKAPTPLEAWRNEGELDENLVMIDAGRVSRLIASIEIELVEALTSYGMLHAGVPFDSIRSVDRVLGEVAYRVRILRDAVAQAQVTS